MPGIAGVISAHPPAERQRLVERMLASMRHETFYTSGLHTAPSLGVCAGWMALEGSFADCQPIANETGDLALVFSGECFSDASSRDELKARGHRIDGNTAAWIIHAYEEHGDRLFEELNGIFCGVLIDGRRRRVLLFNDRYGMDRLYWHQTADGFYFASEAKALLRVLPALRAFDPKGVAQLFEFNCTLGPRTLFRDVQRLPGASVWAFEGGACHKSRYFDASTWESQPPLAAGEFEARLHETFTRILPRYFDTTERIGISLTGGLDTRMIMACLPPGRPHLIGYTFGGEDGDTLDTRIAARVAAMCGLRHHVLRLDATFLSDFASLADRTTYITDGYLGVDGAHEILLTRKARHSAPVRLTGNFGSEILRGVTAFRRPLGRPQEMLSPEYRPHVDEARAAGLGVGGHPVSVAAFVEIPWRLSGLAHAGWSQVSTRTPYLDNSLVALAFRAPATIRRSALPALRLVSRTNPGLGRIPTTKGQRLGGLPMETWLRTLYGILTFKLDYWYNEEAPAPLRFLDAPLAGVPTRYWPFDFHRYLSYRRWFAGPLAPYVREHLAMADSGVLSKAFVDALADEHGRRAGHRAREIAFVLTVEAIQRLLLRQPVEVDAPHTSMVTCLPR
jgi:asparagine synthase (glutamine-hydrolysing)